MMAVIIGRVSEYDPSNITIGGKVVYLPADKRQAASTNFPVGSVAKVTVEKGTVTSIIPPSAAEMATFTRNEQPGTQPAQPPAAAKSPAAPAPAIEAAQKPTTEPEKNIEKKAEVLPGTIISVMIGGTLNLGNYNNVKMEVTATSAEAARAAFQQEISTTVGMMKGIINQVGV